MNKPQTEEAPQINLDKRPSISKITLNLPRIGPYERVLHQTSFTDMIQVVEDLARIKDIAERLSQAVSDIFFFKSQPIDKILDKHFPECKTAIRPVGERRRHFRNDYITITEELK